jgi:hypothetical protein
MIKVENIKVFNFEGAFRGLRNPLESWDRSDSVYFPITGDESDFYSLDDFLADVYQDEVEYEGLMPYYLKEGFNDSSDVVNLIGPKDLKLAQRMIGAGTDESKFMRQIFISMDITAPLFWWKEYDTYKVATVANSCSTMHKLASTPITKELFSFEGCEAICPQVIDYVIETAEWLRQEYNRTKDKKYWRALIEFLPNGWNQKRTVTLNYQNARAMYFARRYHKVDEWRELCEIFKKLPYGEELICYEKEKKNED